MEQVIPFSNHLHLLLPLLKTPPEMMRCYFQVEFIAEEAIDAGGLTKVCKIFTLTHCVHSPLLISVAISFQVVFLGEEAIDEGGLRKVSLVPYYMIIIHVGCLCLNFFHLLAQKPNLEKYSIYSSKFGSHAMFKI
jgi:hypothetical protein